MMHKIKTKNITLILFALIALIVLINSFNSDSNSLVFAADECEKCGPTRLIGCRKGRCYYKCTRRCLGKDNKFYYEAVKFNFAGQK